MIDTKRLRQKILDLAIRGKLVEQDPSDEPASVLLERIRAEKLQMVADGRLKKKDVAKDSIIYRGDDNSHYEKVGDGEQVCIDDELPFELPNGWEWARLGAIAYVAAGSTPPKSAFCEQGIPYYKMYNLRNNRVDFLFQPQYIDAEWHYGKLAKSIIYPGDLIMNIVGPPLGKLAIAPSDYPEANTNQAAVIIRPYSHLALVEWIRYFLMEMTEINRISTRGSAGQVNISLTQSKMMRIPVPPLAEQRRIVAVLDECLGYVDEIEQNQAELESLLAKARSKVLDLAIRGKLVEQDPSDEPASVLLERIRAEKLQMVADGRLRKKDVARDSVIYRGEDNSYYEKVDDGEPVCIDDELPFKLPDGWSWTRLMALCHPQEKPRITGDTLRYIDIDSIDNKRNVVKQPKLLAMKDAPSRANRRLRTGATLFSMVRPYLRNIAQVDDVLSDCIASTGFYVASPIIEGALSSWLFLCMRSDYFVGTINRQMRGDNSPSVRKDEMDAMLIPLPPENEWERISKLVSEALSQFEDCRHKR